MTTVAGPELMPCFFQSKNACVDLWMICCSFCKISAVTDPCKPWTERFPVELGAPSHARCTSNGDPHPVTFDGARYDFFKIGDWLMASSDRRDFEVSFWLLCVLQNFKQERIIHYVEFYAAISRRYRWEYILRYTAENQIVDALENDVLQFRQTWIWVLKPLNCNWLRLLLNAIHSFFEYPRAFKIF